MLNKYSQERNCAATIPIPTFMFVVNDLCIPLIGLCILLQENRWTERGNIQISHRHMNVEIGSEAAQFPEKEYINGIAVAVYVVTFEYGSAGTRGRPSATAANSYLEFPAGMS